MAHKEPSHLDFHCLQMYVRIYVMSEVTRLDPISEKSFTFIVFFLCMYLVLLILPRGAMGWSVICDGGLSWFSFS